MSPLAELPAHLARHDPDAPLLRSAALDLSRAGFEALTRRWAAWLWHVQGVRPGQAVAWLGLNHPAQIALLFALARIGALLVPLNFRLARAEWLAVLDDCGAVLLHDEPWADAALDIGRARPALRLCGPGTWPLGSAPDAAIAPAAVPDHARDDAPVLLVYTSGTTGRPKGAVHTQANLWANMQLAATVQALDASDRVLTVLPLFHVGGLCIQTLPALSAGACVHLQARFDPAATLAALARERITLTLQVPATMQALIAHPDWAGTDLGALRAVWAGSSLIAAPLIEAFHARGVPVCNVYGATETGPFSIALPPAHARTHVGSCGWPAPGVEVELDATILGVGEVRVRGPNVVARYWPDVPACDAQGWFRTGDLARRSVDGSYTIVGRAKDMIISGGENIYPAEVELALGDHPAVAECSVFGVEDAQWGEIPVAAVVLAAGARAPADWPAELAAHLAGRLARYKQPRRWYITPELPKTALGKVQKERLRERWQASQTRS